MLKNSNHFETLLPWLTALTLIRFTGTALAENPYLRSNNSWISISGSVESVSANGFILNDGKGTVTVEINKSTPTIDTGLKRIDVNSEDMTYNPRDDTGYQNDLVRVSGTIDRQLFEGHEMMAETVVELLD